MTGAGRNAARSLPRGFTMTRFVTGRARYVGARRNALDTDAEQDA